MKKKLIISFVLCMLVIFAFSLVAFADDAACEHTYDDWTVVLGENGFLGEITASAKCTACNAVATEIIPKIFITKGYSNSSDGIMQDYGVNREALAKYEALSGETLKFGAVVAIKESIGGKNPLDSSGEPISSKVKSFDYTDTEYSVISVSIKGIPENVKESSGLLCALYVNAGGRTTYLDNCAEKVECGSKTFAEIEAVPEKDVGKLEKVEVIDGTRYHQLTIEEMGFVKAKFWNGSTMQTGASQAFDNKFWTTKSFTKQTLPEGSIIFIDSANSWQYRPHKWSGTRPSNTKNVTVTVDSAWWGNYSNVGFNISMYKGNGPTENTDLLKDISGYTVEQIAEIFKIYIPVTYVEDNAGGDEGGTTTPDQGGDDVVVPSLPDYSAEKQNWQDDGVLKILAIGNSFSDDAMDYVYQVAKDAGVENIKLGKLYIGGCSLATHLANAQGNKSAYDYKINTSGSWDAQGNKSIKFAVESDDWDFITFQQVSGYSGVADSYNDLYELIKIVEPLNPSARLAWHMTWAYQKGSGHSDFSKYNKYQMTMYNAIIGAVDAKILGIDNIEIVIPSGTAIQNVRTSFIGDTLTRDGYHLSYGIGRYIASMTYVKALTGLSIDNSKTVPSDVDSDELAAIIEGVNNALNTPYAVTNSSYKERPLDPTPDVPDTPVVDGEVTIPEGYRQLTLEEMGWQSCSFWNGKAFDYNTEKDFNKSYYGTVNSFTIEDIPVGSIIVLKQGEKWQYRPDGWGGSGSRPGNVTAERVVVDEAWWNGYTERGFNLSKTDAAKINTMTPEEIYKVLVILVPVSESEGGGTGDGGTTNPDQGGTTDPDQGETTDPEQGETTEELVLVEYLDWAKLAYWNSSDSSKEHYIRIADASNSSSFWATRMFTKEQLPVGSVIEIASGYQYRPDGWYELEKRNTKTRPGNISTERVVIDEAWWGDYVIRGFNISKTSGSMTSMTEEEINTIFKIYVPKSALEANKEPVRETILDENGLVKSEACVDEITVIDGVEYRALTAEAMGLTKNHYYWSEKTAVDGFYLGDPDTASKFFATKMFDKQELSNGTLIWVASGYQYRPEGWTYTGSRPGNVTTTYVTANEAWWGSHTIKGFNISKTNSASLVDVSVETIYENFKIYIPVENIAD